jgi:hypothetical protein
MTLLSPAATYHAELREQLSGVGRALAFQRALKWMTRGLAAGLIVVLGVIVWAWTRGTVADLPLPILVAVPILTALLAGAITLFIRHEYRLLARRVDNAAGLQERSTTALELGARGEEFPLALAQMRDAIEHLKRVDLLETFPMRLPRNELLTSFFVVIVAVLFAVSPNPWLLRARAANPAINIAREQAQRVERLAESMRVDEAAELDPLRELLRKGARTIEARSNEPDQALNALEDLEAQIQQMSAGDDQLAAALAAVASALAADSATEGLAAAINTGDLREISRAAQELGAQTEQLSGQDRERVSRVLRDAANRAGRASPAVAGEFSDAASALAEGAEEADGVGEAGLESQPGQSGRRGSNGRSARDALNELSSAAGAAAERQRAETQLEASRNALERALGRTQSRSGSTGRSSSSSGQRQGAGQMGDQGMGMSGAAGQAGEAGAEGAESGAGGAPGSDEGGMGEGQGGGYGTGSAGQRSPGAVSDLDTISTPHQLNSGVPFSPDEFGNNEYFSQASDGAATTGSESVSPTYRRGEATHNNDTSAIPLGLRDLIKDYFSSLDQR